MAWREAARCVRRDNDKELRDGIVREMRTGV